MNLTKRQLTESSKRQDKIFYLMTNKAAANSVGIDYKDQVIYFTDKESHYKEYILGYFIDYKTLKQLQDNIIKFFNDMDQVLNSESISQKINDIRSR